MCRIGDVPNALGHRVDVRLENSRHVSRRVVRAPYRHEKGHLILPAARTRCSDPPGLRRGCFAKALEFLTSLPSREQRHNSCYQQPLAPGGPIAAVPVITWTPGPAGTTGGPTVVAAARPPTISPTGGHSATSTCLCRPAISRRASISWPRSARAAPRSVAASARMSENKLIISNFFS
ncbi:hypothetical protein MRX96_029925 [Rhipicephalus microplus]